MNWTRKKPTEEGYYWHSITGSPQISEIIQVVRYDKDGLMYAFEILSDNRNPKKVDDLYGYFYGPLLLPELNKDEILEND